MASSSVPLQGVERIDGLLFTHEHADDALLNTMSHNGVTEELTNAVVTMRAFSPELSEDAQRTFRRIRDRLTRWPMHSTNTKTSSLVAALNNILNRTSVSPSSAIRAVPMTVDAPAQGTARAARILREVLAKCVAPNPADLKDDELSCIICQQPFLTIADPETPLRLPCGHVCGSNCIMKWLNPLSPDAHNTCPMCREPILNTPFVSAEKLSVMRELREWEAHGDANHITAWAIRAEQLYHNLCEDVINGLERIESDCDLWLSTVGISTHMIDFVTLRNFVNFMNGPTEDSRPLLDNFTDYEEYNELVTHLKPQVDDTDDDDFLSADEATYARVTEWHRRIRVSRDRVLERAERTAGLR